MQRTASCHCRALSISCQGEPAKVSLCHCHECQRRTGSLFSIAAFFPSDMVEIASGQARRYTRPSGSGFEVTFHFCPECGTSLWWEAARLPHLVGVAAGAFTDPAFPMPSQAVWASEKHEWLTLPPHIAEFARNPGDPAGD